MDDSGKESKIREMKKHPSEGPFRRAAQREIQTRIEELRKKRGFLDPEGVKKMGGRKPSHGSFSKNGLPFKTQKISSPKKKKTSSGIGTSVT